MITFFAPIASLTPFHIGIIAIAVILVGIAKGGFGGTFAMFGVPIISLVMPSLQAAAILLPILIVMDIISVRLWWKQWDMRVLKLMLPPALVGIFLGWLLAGRLNEDTLRLMLGVIAVTFVMKEWFWKPATSRGSYSMFGRFWAVLSGFTSFIAHAGGPPYQIQVQPMRLSPATYAATSVFFFAAMNFVKLAPYFALGQFDHTNLAISICAFPLAMIATWLGKLLVKGVNAETFYPILNVALLVVGIYLVATSL